MSGRIDLIEEVKQRSDAEIRDMLFKLLEVYCYPSFGSISKKEFEIVLFGELYKRGLLGSDVHGISRRLRISTSRVKRLLLEYGLRYKDNEDLRKQLKKSLANIAFDRADDCWILLYIEDPYLQEYIQELLKEKGFVTDFSINRSLIKLRDEAFAFLITKVLDNNTEEISRVLNEKKIDLEKVLNQYKDTCASKYNIDLDLTIHMEALGFVKGVLKVLPDGVELLKKILGLSQ